MENTQLLNIILGGGFLLFILIYLYITIGKRNFATILKRLGIRKPRVRGPVKVDKKWFKIRGVAYFLIMILLITLVGGYGYFFTFPYFTCAITLFLLGFIHNFILYSDFLGWSKRNAEDITQDSFGREFAYTFFITLIGAMGFVWSYTSLNSLVTWRIGSVVMFFLLPFIILKARDYAYQIAPHDFEIKWKYPISEIDPNTVYREEGKFVRLEFHFTPNLVDGNPELMWVKAPLDETVGTAFKIAVYLFNNEHEIHQKADNLGYHDNRNLWFLFYKKSFLSKTYLDPNALVEKHIERRMLDERDKIFVERQYS